MLPQSVALSADRKCPRTTQRTLLQIHAFMLETCTANAEEVQHRVASWAKKSGSISVGIYYSNEIVDVLLRSYCHHLEIGLKHAHSKHAIKLPPSFLSLQCDFEIVVITLFDGPVMGGEDSMTSDLADDCGAPCQIWNLPNRDFIGLVSKQTLPPLVKTATQWDALHFEDNTKDHLVRFAHTGLYFANKRVDSTIITSNKLILLHGPPGTGKTSLAKALAHELSISLHSEFNCANLIEINSHSLFSKWFSESGKLVATLFQKIRESLEAETLPLIIILIDEVESLVASRSAAMRGCEPSDAIRVVNSVLTQIDSLKRHINVLIIATSNLADTLDAAFIDRSDLKLEIPLPGLMCRIEILQSCLQELVKKNIIDDVEEERSMPYLSTFLKQMAKLTEGLSGRSLRKLPFTTFCLNFNCRQTPTFEQYCMAFIKGVRSTPVAEPKT